MAAPTVTVTIEKLVQGGKGLARVDGQVLFVRGAIPGERVSIAGGVQHKGFQETAIHEILEASPDRIDPPCPVYERCGGCQLQHLRYEAQLVQKGVMLRETLARVGKLATDDILPVVPSPDPYDYRSTVRFMVFRSGKGFALGFHREGTKEPVAAAGCLLATESVRKVAAMVDERLAALRRLPLRLESIEIRQSRAFGQRLLAFRTDKADKEQAGHLFDLFKGLPDAVGLVATAPGGARGARTQRWVTGQDWIADRLGDVIFRISDRSMTQANWRLLERLAHTVLDWAGDTAGLSVLDLYAGIGTAGLMLARAGALVTFAEANPYALADARHAAKANHIGRCRFRPARAEAMLETMQPGEYGLILVQPPRTGLSPKCLSELLRGGGRLLYLSRDPATLARDLNRLCAGGYRISRLQPFDMAPQTAHLETLVELAR